MLVKAKEQARTTTGKLLSPDRAKMGLDSDLLIGQLGVVLKAAEAREQERVWLKNALSGEADDNRLVDAAVGALNIYKRRGVDTASPSTVQRRPNRLRFVMHVSSLMARFNALDRHLDRMVASTVLISWNRSSVCITTLLTASSDTTHCAPRCSIGSVQLTSTVNCH
jgi:hypothetical protein